MTSVSLPLSVPFPVTVSAVLCSSGDSVQKHLPLVKYKYWDYQDDPASAEDPPPKIRVERIGSFESPIEGAVARIDVRPNDEIAHSGVVLCVINESCTHTVQYEGLCALCGKAVEDEKDYTGYLYEDRATIAMLHDNTGLRISLDEATKIEKTATAKLAAERKLILVVDLDQTVIHATVDPTVGEWQRDTNNPNNPYVRDVRLFALEEEPLLPQGWSGPKPPPSKCWYYVKLRPGLQQFLERVSTLYELHIYTMATRNYAIAIARIIDPTGAYFGDRILSRDESGLLTHKNLRRLFPVDQSMVVIIDDRGDVWLWESNLIKVVPYDFFVGIGDINLSFLPKKNGQLLGPTKRRKSIARLEALLPPLEEAAPAEADPAAEPADASPVDRMVTLGGGENNQNLLREQLMTRSQLVEQQQHERPLAKLQHNLEKIHEHNVDKSDTPSPESNDDDDDEHLLRDDDTELQTLQKALENIHNAYFVLFDQHTKDKSVPKPDLTTIIPKLKLPCLQDVVVLFSGILPLGMNIDNADNVIWCRQFGVRVVNEVFPEVTHVVCRDPSATFMKAGLTLKVRVARKTLPNVKIVSPDWLFACLSLWAKVPEDEYLIDVPELDWYVSQTDVDKYQRALTTQAQMKARAQLNRPRADSTSSIEEYDFNDATAEVDDFLADLSEEGERDDDDDDDNDNDNEDEDNQPQKKKATFIKNLYSQKGKRNANEQALESEDDADEAANYKKQKTEDLDELEQELLDELDNLED